MQKFFRRCRKEMTYKNYSVEEIREAVKISTSVAQSIRRLGLLPVGGNYRTLRKYIDQLGLDVSHFTFKTWNKGLHRPLERYTKRSSIRAALIRLNGHRCWECG